MLQWSIFYLEPFFQFVFQESTFHFFVFKTKKVGYSMIVLFPLLQAAPSSQISAESMMQYFYPWRGEPISL